MQDSTISSDSKSPPINFRMTFYLNARNGQVEELNGALAHAPTILVIATIITEFKRID